MRRNWADFRAPEHLDFRILPMTGRGQIQRAFLDGRHRHQEAKTALRLWVDIGLSVARAGIRKLLILNSHGGNADLISIVARELRVHAGLYVVRTSWGAFGPPEGLYRSQEMTHGLHGGDVETSLMLHFRPETVDMSLAQDFRSSAESSAISRVGPLTCGWIASDLNPFGVVGEAHLAHAETGKATADKMVTDVIGLPGRMQEVSLAGIDPIQTPF